MRYKPRMMTIPLFCVLLAILITYFTKVPVAWAMVKEGGYDNRNPRDQQARLSGWGKRAVAAQNNGFEVHPVFAICVIVGHLTNGNAQVSATLAVLFVISRVAFVALYIADKHLARSAAWMFGMLCCAGIALSSFV